MILPDTGANQADRLIVVGGVAAGMSAAARAKRTDPDIEVVVFEKTAHVSYGACGFPFLIAGTVKDPLDLVAIDAETFRRDRGIDVRTDHEVVELDPVSKIVTAQNRHSGESVTLNYSKLVLSTGGSPRTLGLQGIDRPNVFSLRSLEDAISLKGYIDRTSPKRAVIVGAGYIGLEMAEAFAAHGIAVTIVQRSHRLLGAIDDEISEVVAHELDRNGVHVVYGAQLSRLVGDGTDGPVSAVVCDDVAGPIPTDLVLVAVGVGADSKLAQQAGIRLGATGAIAVNWKQE
ncbi:MAG: FAD-dependent oxidoreductase, partial [Candidatus Latescibacteria bacterium]|nr:FAD-dependent oxidoreductase [Candidatus Latescibacterota bacterium]